MFVLSKTFFLSLNHLIYRNIHFAYESSGEKLRIRHPAEAHTVRSFAFPCKLFISDSISKVLYTGNESVKII
jgi:hypothetical protein